MRLSALPSVTASAAREVRKFIMCCPSDWRQKQGRLVAGSECGRRADPQAAAFNQSVVGVLLDPFVEQVVNGTIHGHRIAA